MKLTEFHSRFPGSVNWRVTPQGVDIQGAGFVPVSAAALARTKTYVDWYADYFRQAATETGVPVELLIACSLTESINDNPKTRMHENETCVREEPGFISDEVTPHRISAGLCQLLISTARTAMKDKTIDRTWLLNPANSIRACAAFMRDQGKLTGFDPVYAACAYNSGGLYEQKGEGNRWKLRQFPIGTGNHANRFVEYFTAAMTLTGGPEWEQVSVRRLLKG